MLSIRNPLNTTERNGFLKSDMMDYKLTMFLFILSVFRIKIQFRISVSTEYYHIQVNKYYRMLQDLEISTQSQSPISHEILGLGFGFVGGVGRACHRERQSTLDQSYQTTLFNLSMKAKGKYR